MNFKIKHIIEGIKNTIFVKDEVEKIAEERYAICAACPKNSKVIKEQQEYSHFSPVADPGKYYSALRPDEHCSVCACNLHAKVRSLHTNCPIDKWPSVATKEEAAKIAAAIDGN